MADIEDAAKQHTNLNIFQAVIQIMEGGLLYGHEVQKSASQIVKICKHESAACLQRYYTACRSAENE